MERYHVKLTDHAIGQLSEIMIYISKDLCAPQAAQAWSDKLRQSMESLAVMPNRYPSVPAEPWKTRNFRKMNVGHYLVYYYIDTCAQTVWISAVVYGKRDQLQALLSIPEK